MSEPHRPGAIRGTILATASLVAALLATAPLAVATSDPLEGGQATIVFDAGFKRQLNRGGVELLGGGATRLHGRRATFRVSSGELDPALGAGTVGLAGRLDFRAGKRRASVSSLVIDTRGHSLIANVAGKKLRFAALGRWSFSRDGFGGTIAIRRLKLGGGAAKRLNHRLGSHALRRNRRMARARARVRPAALTLLAVGEATLASSQSTAAKLTKLGVEIAALPPTGLLAAAPPVFGFPIGGGLLAPNLSIGTIEATGGLLLAQDRERLGVAGAGTTTMILEDISLDLATRVLSADVLVVSPRAPEPNLGPLRQSAIGEVSLAEATATADPATRGVTIENAAATLPAVTAEVLNAAFVRPLEMAGRPQQERFAPGERLGTLSLTAQTR